LGGRGTLAGAVTIQKEGVLLVGDTLASDHGLTFKGKVTLSAGAVLQLNDAMMNVTKESGKEYKAFTLSGGSVSGTFAEIIPATPGEGLEWDTSDLYTKGILRVALSTAIIPANAAVQTKKEYFLLSGERIDHPAKDGLYLERVSTPDGKAVTRKVGK